ncbi:efflux RND transporter periplasmic adaptor subunit [Falsiphaeobacter marinintestinus]|uniref:efflux RND transporter periplasmic adaptor subunit n=1 Tax=Falsiphaeobacter marinintestinus TaxID=1492905 RepID=UPI0011B5A192|nr:efflux RND transporter periplasmic adaptor subunit [Phaeobacter marinintestinus]
MSNSETQSCPALKCLADWLGTIVVVFFLAGSAVPALAQAQSSEAVADSAGFPAQIEPLRRADVNAAVESTIEKIHFEAGQTIAAGDIVVTLDNRKYQLAVKNAEANYRRAEKVLEGARSEFERTQKLKDRGTVSGVQMLKAKVSVVLSEAVLDQAQATLETEQTNLNRTVLRAPITGIISRPKLDVGGLVSPGFSPPLAHIVQMDPILVAYKIPYLERLNQLGVEQLTDLDDMLSQVELTIKVSDTWTYEHKARPKHGSAGVDPETGEMTIWAEVPNPRYLLRPGLRVTVFSNLRLGDLDQ